MESRLYHVLFKDFLSVMFSWTQSPMHASGEYDLMVNRPLEVLQCMNTQNAYKAAFAKWIVRLKKCVDVNREYFEGLSL